MRAPDPTTPALEFVSVYKSYRQSSGEDLHAVRNISLRIDAGTCTAIVGRSGSGKSTLLHLAAGIDEPTRGQVFAFGDDLAALSERSRTVHRRDRIGLVFQFFHLLPHLTVLENVALPGLIAGDPRAESLRNAHRLLDRVGLEPRSNESADRLSGGEMQRVAICRALLRNPQIVLADEPTGNLDDANGRAVMELLLSMSKETGRTLIYVTHSAEMARHADRRLSMSSGELQPATA